MFLSRLMLVVLAMTSSLALAQDKATLSDGSIIEYYLALPQSSGESSWPLAIFMGGGSGNKPISFEAYRFVARDLAERGWAVAVPVSPDNQSFRGSHVARIEELIEILQARDDVTSGKSLIGGISNGGMSALEIARQNPQGYLGIMAVPAIARNAGQLATLAGMPVYLRIGGDDQLGWAQRFDETVAVFNEIGVKLDADILDGAPHMFGMDWDRLDPWLDAVKQ